MKLIKNCRCESQAGRVGVSRHTPFHTNGTLQKIMNDRFYLPEDAPETELVTSASF